MAATNITSAMAADGESAVPVIDLNNFPAEYSKLLRACKDWGCFRVVNHGVPEALLREMRAVVRRLFDRPEEVKRRNVDVIAGSGYVARRPGYPHYEALGLYDIKSADAVASFCTQLDASDEERETIKCYADQLHAFSMNIGNKIAESLNLSRNLFSLWPCQFRINKYHFTKETVGSPGVIVHTDSSFLTVLQEDDYIGGLEVDKNDRFLAVDPVPGSLLVNLGDVAKAWSNGMFKNLKHRVQCVEAATRFTIAMFLLGPKNEAIVAPEELVSPNFPRMYVPFTYEEFRKLRVAKNLHAGEALAFYASQEETKT